MKALAVLGIVTVGLLAGCSPQQLAGAQAKLGALEVQAVDDGKALCQVRDQVVPFVKAGEAVAAAFVPQAGALVALDQTTVSPVLDRACKAVGGIVVAPPKG